MGLLNFDVLMIGRISSSSFSHPLAFSSAAASKISTTASKISTASATAAPDDAHPPITFAHGSRRPPRVTRCAISGPVVDLLGASSWRKWQGIDGQLNLKGEWWGGGSCWSRGRSGLVKVVGVVGEAWVL